MGIIFICENCERVTGCYDNNKLKSCRICCLNESCNMQTNPNGYAGIYTVKKGTKCYGCRQKEEFDGRGIA